MKKVAFLLLLTFVGLGQAVYYGTEIGDFANRFHNVKGKVYAVDSRTIFIKVNTNSFFVQSNGLKMASKSLK